MGGWGSVEGQIMVRWSGNVQVNIRLKSVEVWVTVRTLVDLPLVMNVFCLGTAQIRPSGIINTASDATEETQLYRFKISHVSHCP